MRYLLVASLICACGSDDAVDPNAPPTVVSGIAVDTFIVMRHAQGGIHLVDPDTGVAGPSQATAYGGGISSVDDDVAISPDHQRIAWVGTLGTVVIGHPELVDGLPTIVVERSIPDATTQGLAWTPDGDRIVTSFALIDPDTGDKHVCPDDDASSSPIVLDETMPVFPGSRRYVCPDGLTLYDDGVFVGRAGYALAGDILHSPLMTADGQLYGIGFHVPSAAARPISYTQDPLWENWGRRHFHLPDGKTLIPPEAPNDDGYLYDMPAIFASGTWARATERWSLRYALQPFLTGGDAALPEPLALVDNGRAVIYGMRTLVEGVCDRAVYGDKCNIDMGMIDSDSAVVEVTADGTTRGGTLTSTMVDGFIRLNDEVFDLHGDDVLVSGWTPKDNGQEPHLVGLIDGDDVHYAGFGTLTPDGRWLYGFRRYTANPNEGGLHCFLDRDGDRGATCFTQSSQGTPIGFVGQGVKAGYDAAPPAIAGVSRSAAPPGEPVVVFGAHFGTSGTLTVGGTPVTDIDRWDPNQIRFRMPNASGPIALETAHGSSGYRDFHVGVSAPISTAFDGMTTSEVNVGQGINRLDLGEVDLDDAAFVPSGAGYAYFSSGAAPARATDIELHAGSDTRVLRVHEEDRAADATRWQLAAPSLVLLEQDPRLDMIGDALVSVADSLIPHMSGERLLVDRIEPRLYFGGAEEHGMPDQWQNVTGGAWTISRFDANPGMPLWSMRFLTGWRNVQPDTRLPVYADSPKKTFPFQTRGLAGRGQVVLATGLDADLQGGGYQLSSDGGQTFTPHDAGTALPLREPLVVEAQTPFFLVFEASYSASGVAVHAVDLGGALTLDVLPPLVDASLAQWDTVATSHLARATHGGKVALRFENTHTLYLADLDAALPAWTTLANVRTIYQRASELFVVMLDGSVQRSSDWTTFAPFDLGIALDGPVRAVPVALHELDGRWLVLAQLFDATAPTTPSALASSGFLLGPKP